MDTSWTSTIRERFGMVKTAVGSAVRNAPEKVLSPSDRLAELRRDVPKLPRAAWGALRATGHKIRRGLPF